MARKQTPTLTEAELRLMRILWEHNDSTVSDVMEKLPKENKLAYNTVLTTLRILEQKGYLIELIYNNRNQNRKAQFYPVMLHELRQD